MQATAHSNAMLEGMELAPTDGLEDISLDDSLTNFAPPSRHSGLSIRLNAGSASLLREEDGTMTPVPTGAADELILHASTCARERGYSRRSKDMNKVRSESDRLVKEWNREKRAMLRRQTSALDVSCRFFFSFIYTCLGVL